MSTGKKFLSIFKFLNQKKIILDPISNQASKNTSSLIAPYTKENRNNSSPQSGGKKQLFFSGIRAFFARMKRVFSLKKKEAAPSGLSDCYRPCTVEQSERSISLNDTGCGLNLNQEFFSKKQMPKRTNPLLLKNSCISEIDEQSSEKCDDSSMEYSSTRLPDYIRRLQVQIEEKLSENTKIISEIQCLFHSENRRNEDLDYVLSKISLNFGKFFPPILLSKLSSYIDDRKNIENVFNTYQSFIFKMTDLAKQKLEKKSKHSLTYQKDIPVTDLDIEEENKFMLNEPLKKEMNVLSNDSSHPGKHNDAQRLLNALDKTKKNVIDIRNCLDNLNKKLDYLMNENEQQDLEYSNGDSKAFTHGLGFGK